MEDKTDKTSTASSDLTITSTNIQLKKEDLCKESLEIINQTISEPNAEKVKDLTELFNLNLKKKTMVRLNKANDLLDLMTDQSIDRLTKRPDEISNQELLQGIKVIQDLIDRSQKQISSVPDAPLIQINQQTNEVNLDGATTKESRDKVKNAVAKILANIETTMKLDSSNLSESGPIETITIPTDPVEDEEEDD